MLVAGESPDFVRMEAENPLRTQSRRVYVLSENDSGEMRMGRCSTCYNKRRDTRNETGQKTKPVLNRRRSAGIPRAKNVGSIKKMPTVLFRHVCSMQ